MRLKASNPSIYYLFVLLILGLVHTFPLWNLRENLAAGYGDPMAHAAIGGWYCGNVLTGDFRSDQFMAPSGVDLSGNYDSPFPFILTCPFVDSGSLFQFHLFALLQILLIIFSAWLVATRFLKNPLLQVAYILFVWWCGFYISRSHQHLTLLSMIWGMQFVFYSFLNLQPRRLKNVLTAGLLLGLSFTGSFQNIPGLFMISLALGLYSVWKLRRDLLDSRSILNMLMGCALASIIFFGLWGPMIAFTLKNGMVPLASQRQLYNLDLLSPFIPSEGHWIYSWWPGLMKLGLERSNSFDPLVLILVLVSVFSKKFWKDSLRVLILFCAVIYFILALGPELRIGDDVFWYLDFNSELFNHFPFSVTRTPGRLAVITNLCLIFLAFLFLDQWKIKRPMGWPKIFFSVLLIAWPMALGPLMNEMWFFPTLNYTTVLPISGLTVLRNLPQDSLVVQIPSAWAQDPSQNFNQLFHNKKITSGYLAYPLYNKEVSANILKDPFVGKMGCDGEATAFVSTPLFANPDSLRQHLTAHKYRGFIINKQILTKNPACKNLMAWVIPFLKLPWIKVSEENNLFVVGEIQ